MVFLVIIIYAALALIDVPRLIKKKYWRDLIVYSALMALAVMATLFRVLDVNVPNPVRQTQYVAKWLFEQIHLTYGQ